jgi:hypothetical protein
MMAMAAKPGSRRSWRRANFQVAQREFEPSPAPHLARGFANQRIVAELAERCRGGFCRRLTSFQSFFCGHVEMSAQFFIEILFEPVAAKKAGPKIHASPRAISPAMAALIRAQRPCSSASCFFPLAVRL